MKSDTLLAEAGLQRAIEDLISNLIPYAIQRFLRISPTELSAKITLIAKDYTEKKINEHSGECSRGPAN